MAIIYLQEGVGGEFGLTREGQGQMSHVKGNKERVYLHPFQVEENDLEVVADLCVGERKPFYSKGLADYFFKKYPRLDNWGWIEKIGWLPCPFCGGRACEGPPGHGSYQEHGCFEVLHKRASEEIITVTYESVGDYDLSPTLPGWVVIRSATSGGRACNYVTAVKGGTPVEKLAKWLNENPPKGGGTVIVKDGRLVVEAKNLNNWIGRGGRWAKAYEKIVGKSSVFLAVE